MVLKQCGHEVITFFVVIALSDAMFCCACSCQRYSFPRRLAGSPLQVSALPRIANETFAAFRIAASALATRWLRRSSDAARAPKEKYSAFALSPAGGAERPSAPPAPGSPRPPPGLAAPPALRLATC